MRWILRITLTFAVGAVGLVTLVGCVQRRLLYFPTHNDATVAAAQSGLQPWQVDGQFTGYARVVPQPRKIWFVLHGNAGQAAGRGYVVQRIDPRDNVFILEYPGFGARSGSPSREAFDSAALKAYEALVANYGVEHLIVLGESLGSGPASQLAKAKVPPRHIVLVVPFDVLTDVAQEKFSVLPVKLMMLDRWDNVAALHDYSGELDIFGGTYDPIIPVHHARHLAQSVPGARYHEFAGGHNWAESAEVDLTRM